MRDLWPELRLETAEEIVAFEQDLDQYFGRHRRDSAQGAGRDPGFNVGDACADLGV